MVLALYVLELSAVLVALALYKRGARPPLVFLAAPAGRVVLVAVPAIAASALVIVHQLRRSVPGRASFAATLTLNLLSVLLMFCTAEGFVRVFATTTPAGPAFAGTLLFPRSWENVAARGRAILRKASAQGSFLVYDDQLGWTLGANRRSADYNLAFVRQYLAERGRRLPDGNAAQEQWSGFDGPDDNIYLSSVEGIRSPRVGMSFATIPAKRRIALVGDSFTFGLEVRYEETWGHQLELALGPEFQVLNFGVDGYGVDQAYLRYRRDVVSWHPDIVILGVIDDDLRRTMCVYGFMCFPRSEIPFPKPRFVVRGDTLVLLNVPLATPDSLFTKKAIAELPFIEHEGSFDPVVWERHSYHAAYSIRFLLSRYRRWYVPGPTVTDEALRDVNGHLLRAFVRSAHEHDSAPIVVYFPSGVDFVPDPGRPPSVAQDVLERNGIPYLDMTDCVSRVRPTERFGRLHYSAATNAAVAKCLRDWITVGILRQVRGRRPRPSHDQNDTNALRE